MERIFITGYRGFIGQNAVKRLSKDYDLVLYEWGDGEINLDGVDRVIHMGAISSTTYSDVRQIMRQNYHFTCDLLDKCLDRQIPLQISSSASIYGPNNTSFSELDPPDPRTPYAWTKYLVEDVCSTFFRELPIQLFRYFNVFGPHEGHKGDQASPYHKFKQQLETDGRIKLFIGSENFCRDFVPVERVIDTHVKFFDINDSGIWNIGSGVAKSFYEVAQEIGGPIDWIEMPDNLKASYQPYTCADLSKLSNTLSGR